MLAVLILGAIVGLLLASAIVLVNPMHWGYKPPEPMDLGDEQEQVPGAVGRIVKA